MPCENIYEIILFFTVSVLPVTENRLGALKIAEYINFMTPVWHKHLWFHTL